MLVKGGFWSWDVKTLLRLRHFLSLITVMTRVCCDESVLQVSLVSWTVVLILVATQPRLHVASAVQASVFPLSCPCRMNSMLFSSATVLFFHSPVPLLRQFPT
eukprot:1153304-Pelagomonas_calceolata.AAC.1